MAVLANILATTLERSRKKLIIAAMQSNALMAWCFASERIENEPSGYNITNPLLTGRNPNVGTFEYYDALPVGQTQEFEKLEYRWSRFAGTVIISNQEEDENKGEQAAVKLLQGKMEALELSIKEKWSTYLYGLGGGTDPNGLAVLIPDDPTTGSLGGISRVDQVQWRPSSYNFAGGLNSTNIEEAYDDVLLDLKQGPEKPTVAITGRNQYRLYRAAVRAKLTIPLTNTKEGKRMMDLGFDGISHQGVPILYDESCPVDRTYFINDRYIRLHILGDNNMKKVELTAPWTIDGHGSRVITQAQFCSWKQYRTHAVVND
jgi:hypothetical protein